MEVGGGHPADAQAQNQLKGKREAEQHRIDEERKAARELSEKLTASEQEKTELAAKLAGLEAEIGKMKKEAEKFNALKEQLKHLAGD